MLFFTVFIVIALFASIANGLVEAPGMQAGRFMNETNAVKSELSCSYSATCSAGGQSGVCVSISAGCCSGTVKVLSSFYFIAFLIFVSSNSQVTSNLCPGSADVKCCTLSSCSTPSGSGQCKSTSSCSASGGKSVAGANRFGFCPSTSH